MSKGCNYCGIPMYYDNSNISIPDGSIKVRLEDSYKGFNDGSLCTRCSLDMLRKMKECSDKTLPLKVLLSSSYFCGFVTDLYAHLEITGKHSIDEALELGIAEIKQLPFKKD